MGIQVVLAEDHAPVPAGRTPSEPQLDRLTPRELEILREMATGKSNLAIATILVLSERTVEKHTNSIFWKLGLSEARSLNRRVTAVLMCLDENRCTSSDRTVG